MPNPDLDIQEVDATSVSAPAMAPQQFVQMAPQRRSLPDMTVENAHKTLQFFQDNPRYLANPLTRHAAESVFSSASKVVGMNMQLERLNTQAEIARARNSITSRIGQSLVKMAESGEVGAGIAATWSALDDNGKPLYDNPANASRIFEDYRKLVAEEKIKDAGKIVSEEVTMPDKSTIQIVRNTTGKGYTVVPKQSEVDASISSKEAGHKISNLQTDARNDEKEYQKANADYVQEMAGQKVEGQTAKGLKAKADFYRAKQNEKLAKIESLRKPAANAPTAATTGLQEGQRVRSRVTGKFGTVKDGVVVPDPDNAQ